jgi:hypothetical protein
MSENEEKQQPTSEEKSENSAEESSLETQRKQAKKWVQGTAQSFIQWMPLGTSGITTINFLIHQEWLMSIVMFPVMIVTVIWANYTEGVLTQLGEIYAERGKQDVNDLMSWQQKMSESLRETIKWQLAGTDDKYLKCQASDCKQYQTEGFNTFKPNLRDVYVPLGLSSGGFQRMDNHFLAPEFHGFRWQKEFLKKAFSETGISIWEMLRNGQQQTSNRSLFIQAKGGYGKTTLLRHITYIYTHYLDQKRAYQAPKLLPVLLYFRKWQGQIGQENAPDLPTLIEKYHIPNLAGGKDLKLPPNWAINHLKNGKFLILLDGFDEVKESLRIKVSHWLSEQLKHYPNTFFILTSRPVGYKFYQGETRPNVDLWVKPLNLDQQSRFIEKWYHSWENKYSSEPSPHQVSQKAYQLIEQIKPKETEDNLLSDFAQVPLLLHIIVNVDANSHHPETLPQRRTDLFRDIMRLQLGDRPLARQQDMSLEWQESQRVLQQLALFMMLKQDQDNGDEDNGTRIEPDLLLEKFQDYLTPMDESIEAKQFLKEIEYISELLVKVDDYYEFAHKNFQEYLASLEIKETRQEDLLLENHQDPWWKETILLYGIQLRNPSPFIRRLIGLKTEKGNQLATLCLQQTLRKVEEGLRQEIENLSVEYRENARYQRLAELLKNRNFKEADYETYRVMLEVVGKEEGDWLYPDNIDTFPCEDLRMINQLWLDNSEGKFGFSVQAEIYRSLGGTREYNEEIWLKFSDQVGWRKGGEWLNTDEIIYELHSNTPKAHLPFTYLYGFHFSGLRAGGGSVSSLAQRLVSCRISPSQPLVNK